MDDQRDDAQTGREAAARARKPILASVALTLCVLGPLLGADVTNNAASGMEGYGGGVLGAVITAASFPLAALFGLAAMLRTESPLWLALLAFVIPPVLFIVFYSGGLGS